MVAQVVLIIALIMSQSSQSAAQPVDPAREFLDGDRKTFSTKGHPKAKGVNLTISYPNSWVAAEGERPNIVQKFVSDGGNGLENIIIITKEIPLPDGQIFTTQDMIDLFDPAELREFMPDGAVFVSARSTEIEGIPAGILEYMIHGERLGVQLTIHTWVLIFVYGNIFVQIQFGVAGSSESTSEVERRMTAFRPLFMLMSNTIVLPDKWMTDTQVPASVPTHTSASSSFPHDESTLFMQTLFISLFVTWGIGLTPPLLIRYALVRRPVSKKAGSWLAAGFSTFFWMVFLLLNSALGQRPGTGVVWIIMFFVARWIMSRGYVASAIVAPVAQQPGRG